MSTEHEGPTDHPESDDDEIVTMRRAEVVALAQEVVEFRRELRELASVLIPLLRSIEEWMRLRNAIVTSILTRPIQWAVAVCIVAGLGALIWRGQAIDALNFASKLAPGGGTSIVVTGQPSSHPAPTTPSDGSTTTP